MQSYAEEWPDVLGIEHFQVDLSASPGESVAPREPAYLEGAFDADLVRTKLLELGYEEQESSGRTYYSIRQDYQTNLRDPRHRISLSSMNRVYITDDILIASPYTEFMTTMLDTMDGAVEFLAEDPAFSILAESLGDPLGAVLMDRPTVMNPDAGGLSVPDKQPGWGELHVWDALGAGYGRQEDGSSRITFSLLYSDPDAAGVDEGELLSRMKDYRMETYGTSPDEPVLPFILFCDSLASRTQVHDAGSTLSITCDSAKAQKDWALLVDDRDLGFLLP